MPKFTAIGYGDHAGYDRTPEAVRQAAHAHDDALVQRGAVRGIAATPVQVRNHENAGVQTETGPFRSAKLPVAGFSILDAKDIYEAIEQVAETPCAVAHGVVELQPWKE